MNGSGCRNCPVEKCDAVIYRGSKCRVYRATLGLGDPKTNYDHIRSMSLREFADFIRIDRVCPDGFYERCREYESCTDCWEAWLEQEVSHEG